MNGPGTRVYIETYGCQMNEADTEMVSGLLARAGFDLTSEAAVADVILLNTCAVRERAEERVAGRVKQLGLLKRYRPDLRIGLMGCMAKHLGGLLLKELPEVDLMVGPDSYRRMAEILIRPANREPLLELGLDREERYEGIAPAREGGYHAWVPVMRGCDRFCTFCVVPLVRGREKSLPAGEIVSQVERLAAAGTVAVTLLGQTVNSYRDGQTGFAELLDRIAGIDGLARIRFTSPHPADFTPEVFEVMASQGNLCRHLHLPVQSGSDAVLTAMKRGHTREEFIGLVDRIRRTMPDASLTTDLLVGFPGETDDDLEATLALMREVRFDGAFMFRYSPRPGTYAFRKQPDDIPDTVKARRLERVIALQEEISSERYARWVGRDVEVMIEGASRRDANCLRGKSDDFKTVILPTYEGWAVGRLRRVRIARATSHTLIAEGVAGRTEEDSLEEIAAGGE